MTENCSRSRYEIVTRLDAYGEVDYEYQWVQPCKWKAVTTFTDVCEVCGQVYSYPNPNGYEEKDLSDD